MIGAGVAASAVAVATGSATAQWREPRTRTHGAGHGAREGDDRRAEDTLKFRLDTDLRIYLHREPIDFRAGINSLVTLVELSMQLDPLARAVYAFHNRNRNPVKLLLYNRSGLWLMLKRLEADHFVWPRRLQMVIELTTA